MFEKRVIIGKKYCVTAPSACLITANINGVIVTLVDESTAGQYYFYAPTSSINSSVDPSYILEVAKSGGASTTVRSGSSCNCEPYELTAEAIQEVAPIAWYDTYTTPAEATRESSIALGQRAWAKSAYTTALGVNTGCYGNCSTSVGNSTVAQLGNTTAIGAYLYSGSSYIRTTSEAPQTVVIGNGAQILNSTDANGNTVQSSNSVTIGTGAMCTNLDSVVIGANAKSNNAVDSIKTSVVIGAGAYVYGGGGNVAIGTEAKAAGSDTTIGFNATGTGGHSVVVGSRATNNGAQKTTLLGSSATIINTTIADGTVIKSENSTVIGYGASASAPNAIVMGAGASTPADSTVVIGANAKACGPKDIVIGSGAVIGDGIDDTSTGAILVGSGAKITRVDGRSVNASVVIGHSAHGIGDSAFALGNNTESAVGGIALGTNAKASDMSQAIGWTAVNKNRGTSCIKVYSGGGTDGGIATNFYIMGANSPLANDYENGAASIGYVVRNENTGEILAAGTRPLAELLTNNSNFAPATIDENGEWVMPKVFHPSDLDFPIEEPTEKPEAIEINIPEPEEEPYTPLPVYSIIESEPEEIEEV